MKALIITPYLTTSIKNLVDIPSYDLILCADSAYLAADKEGIAPHLVIGDFDHEAGAVPHGERIVTVPAEKDDTDTMLCLKHAIEQGAAHIDILGGIGGRLDHTFANLQALAYAEKHGVSCRLLGERDEAFLLRGSLTLPRREGWYLSVFAFGGNCHGVTEKGTKYEVENASLTWDFPLGVSNEITAEAAEISVREGTLLIILSKKESAKTPFDTLT